MKQSQQSIIKNIDKILEIGIALSTENSYDRILEMILKEARSITNADAGTMYLCEGDSLSFKVMQNDTLEKDNKKCLSEENLPPLPMSRDNAAGFTALTGEILNIPDAYKSSRFNFSGPRKYDNITGYRTVSMLVAPLKNPTADVIGVMQIINARDKDGNIIPFSSDYEKLVSSLASQAAVTITNIWHMDQIKELMNSFVQSMATAIDSRTPYNASHTKRVAELVQKIIKSINDEDQGRFRNEYFDQDRTDQLIMACWLHDIGKISTPLSIMNKSTRLGDQLQVLMMRLDYISCQYRTVYLKKSIDENEVDKNEFKLSSEFNLLGERELQRLENQISVEDKIEWINDVRRFILKINQSDYIITMEDRNRLEKIAELVYFDEKGKERNWLSSEEIQKLSIQTGTLSESERKMIEKHVEVGLKILQNIPFMDKLKRVPVFVAMHHEFLDGSGYPAGLKGDSIPLEARILTTADIFDALTSFDRPYRKASSIETTLSIMQNMAEEGKLDKDLFKLLNNIVK